MTKTPVALWCCWRAGTCRIIRFAGAGQCRALLPKDGRHILYFERLVPQSPGHAWQGIEFNGDGGYLSVVLGNIDHEILAP